jgi:RHS repeat-associated protein
MRIVIAGLALTLSASIGAAPSVTLVAPAPGVRYVSPAAIELAANPTVDPGRTVERVEFLADGDVVGIATQAPYTFSWTNVARGNYNLRARVYDSEGRRDASPVVRVHVRDNTAPKVRLSAPEHRYIAPGAVPLSATVTDRDDPIAKVEFFSGATLLATSTAEPYAFDWTGVPAGNYDLQAKATDTLGAIGTSNTFRVRVRDNLAPHVRILTPGNNETFPAPASIAVSLRANDRDDNLTNVELFANGSSLALFTGAAPYEFNWANVTPGTYALTAVATDDLGLVTTSRIKTITVTGVTQPPAEPKAYFIHVDHLNTPRLIADEQQRVVWRWDQAEPFGNNVPDENPSGLGAFEFPMRFPGQYFDKETNLHYNYFRDYDASIGRYIASDLIGLAGGLNTYEYGLAAPLTKIDSNGLAVTVYCRPVGGMGRGVTGYLHCYVEITCPDEGWKKTFSMFGNRIPTSGYKQQDGPGDTKSGAASVGNVKPKSCRPDACGYEKSIQKRFDSFPSGDVYYRPFGPNSNSFVNGLLFGNLPAGAPSSSEAPGINYPHPAFPN